jgi:hypothetical protein
VQLKLIIEVKSLTCNPFHTKKSIIEKKIAIISERISYLILKIADTRMRIFYAFFFLLVFLSCSKTNTQNSTTTAPVADLKTQLAGNWKVTKYIVYDFNPSYIPNDTIYPIHPENWDFTNDSVYMDSWETFIYSSTTNPWSFSNTQTKEFTGTYLYSTTTTSYNVFVNAEAFPYDVLSVTADSLLVKEDYYAYPSNPTSVPQYRVNTYLHR